MIFLGLAAAQESEAGFAADALSSEKHRVTPSSSYQRSTASPCFCQVKASLILGVI